MTTTVLVVGAGAVGSRVARRLVAVGDELSVAVADASAAVARSTVSHLGGRGVVHTGAVDGPLTGPAEVRPTVAVLAHPGGHADLAGRLLADGVGVVSVSDDVADVRALLRLDATARRNGVPLVVGAAASPGLSGLLARHLSGRLDTVDEVHVAVHGTGGPACAHQHHRALAGTAYGWHDRQWIERPAGSGRELCWFPEPLGAWDCYRAEIPDPLLLVRAFPHVQRVSARMSANRRDRLTARLPMLRPPHAEGGLGGVRVEVRGERDGERVALVAGVTERVAIVAAQVAAAFAAAAVGGTLTPGLVVPGDSALDTVGLLRSVASGGMSLQEFVGTEARTGW